MAKAPKKAPRAAASSVLKIAAGLKALAVPIDSLRPDPNNANDHPADNLAAIKSSLARFGQLKAVVASADGTLRAGTGTWLAAKEMGAVEIAAVRIPKELEGKAEEFSLADNQTARLSRWNPAKLKAAIERMKAAGGLASDLGFNDETLAAMLAKVKPPTITANTWRDEAPTGKRRTTAGDLWALGDHRLLVADCRDERALKRMMAGRKAQLVFTDPPYGVDFQEDKPGQKRRTIKNDALVRDNFTDFLTAALKAAVEVTASDAAFYIWHANVTRGDFEHAIKNAGLEERQYLIWAKPFMVIGRSDYQWAHEPCFYCGKAGSRPAFYAGRAETTLWRIAAQEAENTAAVLGPGLIVSDGKGAELSLSKPNNARKLRHLRVEQGKALYISDAQAPTTVWEVSRDTQKTIHPTQKPVELAEKALFNSTQAGQAVLDLFGGSGSTLMAAETTGRTAFLAEIDPKYADAILRRWESFTKQKAEKL